MRTYLGWKHGFGLFAVTWPLLVMSACGQDGAQPTPSTGGSLPPPGSGGNLASGGAAVGGTTPSGGAVASSGGNVASGGAVVSGGSDTGGGSGGVSDPCATVTCGPDQTCTAGECACSTGMACPDGCFDTQTDQDHCGDCTTKCAPDGACVDGACVNPMCNVDTQSREGHITTYNLATPLVACHYPTNTLPQYYGAMNEEDWKSSSVCGACVEITNKQNSKKLTLQITDECPILGNEQWCFNGSHHIDLNSAAYGALGANNNPAVSWKYVPCEVSGNIKFNFDASCQKYFLQVTPMNSKNVIAKMEAKKGTAWVTLVHTNYNTYEAEMGVGEGELTFRLTDIYNHVVTDVVTMKPGEVVDGNVQFAACP